MINNFLKWRVEWRIVVNDRHVEELLGFCFSNRNVFLADYSYNNSTLYFRLESSKMFFFIEKERECIYCHIDEGI